MFVKSGGWGDGDRFCELTKKKHDLFTYSDHGKPGRHDHLEIWNNKRVELRLTGLNYWVIYSLNQKYILCYSTQSTSQVASLHFWQVVYKVLLTDSGGSCYYWSINHTWVHANMQTRDNKQQGVDWGSANSTCRSYWDVFDRCDWQLWQGGREKCMSTPGRLRRDWNTLPDMSRATSAMRVKTQKHFCSGSHMHERLDNVRCSSTKSSCEGEEGLMAQLLYSGFLFSTPSGCVSISFGQKYPCLSLVVHEFPRGAKHNPKTPDAELHVFKIKSQAVTFEVYRQAVQSGLNPQTEQGLSPFRLLPL